LIFEGMQTATLTMTRKAWTDEELETLPKNGHKYELLDGDLIMSPVHEDHGRICMRLGAILLHFAESRKLGEVYDSSTGFRLAEDLLLSPDVSFVSHARLKTIRVSPDKFLAGLTPNAPASRGQDKTGYCASLVP
jgi:Uma2 family endonuclease